MRRWILPAILATAACGKSKPGQSYKDAVDIVCHVDDAPGFSTAAPENRPAIMSQWADAKVTNAEGRALIDALGGAGGLERRKLLAEAKAKAGLDTCPVFDILAPWPVPEVGQVPLESLDARATIVISEGKLLLSGDTPVALDQLTEAIKPLADLRPGSLTLILDPQTPYRLVYDVMAAVKDSYHRFALAATTDGERGVVPIVLPDLDAAPPARPLDPAEPLEQMVVGLSGDAVTVFSLSGIEGTLAAPALRVPLTDLAEAQARLQETLKAIVERRWADRTRIADSRKITLIASDDVTAGVFVPVMAAVRRIGETLLYPDVLLGTDVFAKVEEVRDAPHGAFAEVQAALNLDSSLTGEVVASKIERAYLAGIKRCFKDGTAKLFFTVKRNGKTVDARVETDDDTRAACLTSLTKSWVFPPAVDADGDTREPEVTVTLRLGTP